MLTRIYSATLRGASVVTATAPIIIDRTSIAKWCTAATVCKMSTSTKDDTNIAVPNTEQSVKSKPLRRIRVYTRTGDKGTTSLFTSERLSKTSPYFHALGTIDETNAHIGLASEYLTQLLLKPDVPEPEIQQLITRLTVIQSRLFDLGAIVATPASKATAQQLRKFINSMS
jgi:hypothetical protein